jgi:hypothetical protein
MKKSIKKQLELLNLIGGGIRIKRRIHKGWEEFEKAKTKIPTLSNHFGKYQYIYSSDKGEISLVFLPNYFRDGVNFWEICCLSGPKLFIDVERFYSKKQAEKRIRRLL